ncbi:MAG: hypothetical protein HY706_09205 [Candidatus Hydrogenedentes bacterium]|nr:hypothetical protein [Candidatus Hydrogenedentota bacterium]
MARVIKASEVGSAGICLYERGPIEGFEYGSADGNGRDGPFLEVLDPEQIARAAYEQAFQQGLEAGRAAFVESLSGLNDALAKAVEQVAVARNAFLASLEPQVVKLACSVAARILHREARTDPELIQRTARAALENITDREKVLIRLHPHDQTALQSQEVSLLSGVSGAGLVQIIPDASVAAGGCVVETEFVHVDARLDAQIERILQSLLEGAGDSTQSGSND